MCGILGIITSENSNIKPSSIQTMTNSLFKFSESRGKEAAGLAIHNDQAIYVYKQPIPASQMIRSQKYKETIKKHTRKNPLIIIGHSRLVTDGLETSNTNNQPVIKNNIVGIHNGIITNTNELFRKFSIKKEYDVDTEILLGLIQKFQKEENSLIKAVQKTFNNIEGSASVALLFDNNPYLILATNTGSLYTCSNNKKGVLVFASEKHILKKLAEKTFFDSKNVFHLNAGQGLAINLNNLKKTNFNFKQLSVSEPIKEKFKKITIIDLSPSIRFKKIVKQKKVSSEKTLRYNPELKLKRCIKCILPETFPGIKFNEKGVCNVCNNYQKITTIGTKQLEQKVKKFRKSKNQPDCLVGLSGGRDSSYMLHYVKTALKMNPVAFSYDWGMLTDLGRRNQARMCGKLGVEHILVSADIKKKRENIRKNVLAWLKKPDLGTIPLFMAGDKQYFYYAQKLKKQLGIELIILGENLLEKTNFKTRFCGVSEKVFSYDLPTTNKIKIATYYSRKFIRNPAYLNNSLLDTFWAYLCYYFIPHNYINLYEYISWEENKINKTLINKYNWETSKDTKTTWRIGDGTASFYNYIYYTLAGFTENDTFRSNQIREGLITREQALKLVKEENKPRYESIKWYCNTIDIDFAKTIKIINSAPKIYKK